MGKVKSTPGALINIPKRDEISRLAAIAGAKHLFISSSIDMGWRLAVSVLLPVFVGSWLDRRYHTSPLWTFVSLLLALIGSVVIIKSTIENLDNHQPNRKSK